MLLRWRHLQLHQQGDKEKLARHYETILRCHFGLFGFRSGHRGCGTTPVAGGRKYLVRSTISRGKTLLQYVLVQYSRHLSHVHYFHRVTWSFLTAACCPERDFYTHTHNRKWKQTFVLRSIKKLIAYICELQALFLILSCFQHTFTIFSTLSQLSAYFFGL